MRQKFIITKILKLTVFLIISFVTEAQVPTYDVEPTTKKYVIINNPFIKKTKQIEALIINGEAYLEGDIYLGKVAELDQIQRTLQGMRTQSITADDNIINARWENGIVPFTISNDFTEQEKNTIHSALNHIAEKTNVCFKPRAKEGSYIKFKKYTKKELGFDGGTSLLGRCGYCIDGQEVRLTGVSQRLVIHEVCHALGLMHEQCREDRNSSVEILSDNILSEHVNQFDQSIYTTTDVGNYDFNSIMHYPSTAFGKKVDGVTQQTIRRVSNPSNKNFGNATVLSAGDIAGINSMYPKEQQCTDLATDQPEKLAKGEMTVGESKTFTISANKAYNLTGVFMRLGQKFEFTTSDKDWKNGNTNTDCEGYEGTVLDAARRHGNMKMMALVGEIFKENNTNNYTGTYIRIGCSSNWRATKTGFLVCLANDNILAYGDNAGSVILTVKRTE